MEGKRAKSGPGRADLHVARVLLQELRQPVEGSSEGGLLCHPSREGWEVGSLHSFRVEDLGLGYNQDLFHLVRV